MRADATEIRDAQWGRIQGRLRGDCARVHEAWRRHGPCTTMQLAERARMSVLSVRPRTTQLLQTGLVDLVGRTDGEGVYAWVAPEEALRRWRGDAAPARQLDLAL